MNLSIAEVIDVVLGAVQRRKRLMAWPVLIFAALAVLALFIWPRMYTTHSLLMLQERQSANPLSGDGGASRQGRINALEIDALLKSERVLAGAIIDMNLGKKPLTPREVEGEIRTLRKQLGVSVVGSDFIEIELKQSERDGIGERLSIIMTRFFERLLTREDSMKTAREFALEQRQRDLTATSAAIEEWIVRAKAGGAKGLSGDEKLAGLRKRYADLEQKVMASAASLVPGATSIAALDPLISDEIRTASSRLKASEALSGLSERLGALKALETELAGLRTLAFEIANVRNEEARAMAKTLTAVPPAQAETGKALMGEWDGLEVRYAEAVAQFNKHVERAKKGSGPTMTPFGLIAPDSIRIIDEPRDPELPTTSLLKIVLACLGAGIGLGAGLVALAEQLDDRIYDSRGLAKLAGVDTVMRVPFCDQEVTANVDAPGGEVPRKPGRLAVVSRT